MSSGEAHTIWFPELKQLLPPGARLLIFSSLVLVCDEYLLKLESKL
jgi:hypothetical protein